MKRSELVDFQTACCNTDLCFTKFFLRSAALFKSALCIFTYKTILRDIMKIPTMVQLTIVQTVVVLLVRMEILESDVDASVVAKLRPNSGKKKEIQCVGIKFFIMKKRGWWGGLSYVQCMWKMP